MKRWLAVISLVFLLSWTCIAQTDPNSPASAADVERYFQVVKSHDMMKTMLATMSQGIHQLLHEQYLEHKDELPANYESKLTTMVDAMLDKIPMDEIMQAMIPAYQKHLTKGDIDNLVAFYSTPTGSKLLKEMPSMTGEATQAAIPIMSKYMDTIEKRVQKETDDLIAQSKKQPNAGTPTSKN
jgi:uncharacterized protein